jgi:hypothetical protein
LSGGAEVMLAVDEAVPWNEKVEPAMLAAS